MDAGLGPSLCRHLYIQIEELSEALHKYFLYRCKNSVLFSLQVRMYICSLGNNENAHIVDLRCDLPLVH